VAEGVLAVVQHLLTPRGLRESARAARGSTRKQPAAVPVATASASLSNGPTPP
jgi:osmoprotectant transport system permease protein